MTLGNVGKASVDQFAGARKLLLVPLVTAVQDNPELQELVNRYWNEVGEQVRRLKQGLGRVMHLFHEGSVDTGEATLTSMEKANAAALPLVRELWVRDAQIHALEDTETLLETLDLHRCLLLGMASATVTHRLVEWYTDARKRRYELMGKRIDETIGTGQIGLLIIGQDHQLQFPSDMQVVYVAPPALNALHHWFQDQEYADREGGGEASEEGAPEGGPAA